MVIFLPYISQFLHWCRSKVTGEHYIHLDMLTFLLLLKKQMSWFSVTSPSSIHFIWKLHSKLQNICSIRLSKSVCFVANYPTWMKFGSIYMELFHSTVTTIWNYLKIFKFTVYIQMCISFIIFFMYRSKEVYFTFPSKLPVEIWNLDSSVWYKIAHKRTKQTMLTQWKPSEQSVSTPKVEHNENVSIRNPPTLTAMVKKRQNIVTTISQTYREYLG